SLLLHPSTQVLERVRSRRKTAQWSGQVVSKAPSKSPHIAGRVAGIVLLAAATIMLARAAYFTLFSIFRDYDDVGMMLITILQFVQGKALYTEVFSHYGPFYYWFHWLLFRPGWFPLCHDTAGILTIVLWLTSCLMQGLFVWRVTGRLILALVAEIVAF